MSSKGPTWIFGLSMARFCMIFEARNSSLRCRMYTLLPYLVRKLACRATGPMSQTG